MGELLYRGARVPQLPPSLLLLVWAAHHWSRSRVVGVLPALVWLVIALAAVALR